MHPKNNLQSYIYFSIKCYFLFPHSCIIALFTLYFLQQKKNNAKQLQKDNISHDQKMQKFA